MLHATRSFMCHAFFTYARVTQLFSCFPAARVCLSQTWAPRGWEVRKPSLDHLPALALPRHPHFPTVLVSVSLTLDPNKMEDEEVQSTLSTMSANSNLFENFQKKNRLVQVSVLLTLDRKKLEVEEAGT